MARDLIPPPSPAAHPQPAEAPSHAFVELPPEPEPLQAEPGKQGPSAFADRVGFLTGALAGVVVVSLAIAFFAWQAGSSEDDHGMYRNWSSWEPWDTGLNVGATEIADKVAAEYKHPNGEQLVLVKAIPIDGGLEVVLAAGNYSPMNGRAVVYKLSGLGANGSINVGEPSDARGRVVQREALELSLYTFRYLPDAEMVVVLLPPLPPEASGTGGASATDDQPQRAIFFRPGDLKSELQVPLSSTLPAPVPTETTLTQNDATRVEQLVRPNLFTVEFQELGANVTPRFILRPPSSP